MKRVALGFFFLILNVNGMENSQNYNSIVPLTIETAIKIDTVRTRSFIEVRTVSFKTSNVIIDVDFLKNEMGIKYERSSFTLSHEHPVFKEIVGCLTTLPCENKGFIERHEHKGVMRFKEYVKADALSIAALYKTIEQL